MNSQEYFISGIDTDCGKTYITGLLAYHLKQSGKKVITAKHIQTGCKGVSEDIIEHRRLMETGLFAEDKSGLTCPYLLSYPASPHLATEIDNATIDLTIIKRSTNRLLQDYEIVLTEGAGGLMVPITKDYLTIDYIRDNSLPLILVSSSQLGSINHTLLSLLACKTYNIDLYGFIYNELPGHDKLIAESSYKYFKEYLQTEFPGTFLLHSKELTKEKTINITEYLSN